MAISVAAADFSVLHRLVRNFVLSIPGFAIVRLDRRACLQGRERTYRWSLMVAADPGTA